LRIFTETEVRHISTSGLIDLESASHASPFAMKVSTNFKLYTTIRCRVIVLLLLIRYVTLWP